MSSPTPDAAHRTAREVLSHWGLQDAIVTPIREGLINETLRVQAATGTFILQRLHPVFRAEVHLDIDVITARLSSQGLPTPRLVRTRDGALWVDHAGVWRVQTALPGHTVSRVERPARAEAAGALLGRFHAALADCDHTFHFTRQAHGLARHRATLVQALQEGTAHRLAAPIHALADELLPFVDRLPAWGDLPRRITHGDPKISNVLFTAPHERALAWVDLDTLGRLDLPTELGDALRSWCNPVGEDDPAPRLDLPTLAAALTGYAATAGPLLTAPERDLLVEGVAQIAAELACRFAADALQERYFGWDPDRFPGRGEHNLHRARGQWQLARSVVAQRGEAEALVRTAFSAVR